MNPRRPSGLSKSNFLYEKIIAGILPIIAALNTTLRDVQFLDGVFSALISLLFLLAFLTSRRVSGAQNSMLIYSLFALGMYTLISRALYLVSQDENYMSLAMLVLSLPPLAWLLAVRMPPEAFRAVLRYLVLGSALAAAIGTVLSIGILAQNGGARSWAAISMEVSANRNDFALIYLLALTAAILVNLDFRPLIRWSVICIILSGILFSFSRSVYLGLGIMLIASFIFQPKARWLALLLIFATAGSAMIEGSPIGDRIAYTFQGRQGSVFDDSSELRLYLWRSAFELFKESPIFGVGSGHSPMLSVTRLDAEFIYAHNYFITQLFQLGLVGLALTVVMLLSFLKGSLRQQGALKIFGVTAVAIVVGVSLTGEPLYGVALNIFYLMASAMAWSNDTTLRRPGRPNAGGPPLKRWAPRGGAPAAADRYAR